MADYGPSIRKLNGAILTLGDGSEVEVERIGKGRFSTAWTNGKYVYLQTHEDEYAKEICEDIRNPHVPETRGLGWAANDKPWRLYRQPKYGKLRAKQSPEAWAHYRSLQSRWCEVKDAALSAMPWNSRRKPEWTRMCETFAGVIEESHLPSELKEAIRALADAVQNYGETWAFEFTPRNLAVDDTGRLILLDVIFDVDKVR